ncbi:MAG TPA: hypothetical protein VF069_08730, partial [Streptosporangiaceae bacterium]
MDPSTIRFSQNPAVAIGVLAGAAGLLAVWTAVEARSAAPLVDVRLLRHSAVAGANLAMLTGGAGMYLLLSLITRYVQTPGAAGYGFGLSTFEAGLALVPFSFFGFVAGKAARRAGGHGVLAGGTGIVLVSFVLFALAPATSDKVISIRGARSASPTDATYQTAYTYTAAGQVTTIKTPATADFQSGRTTRYAYTAGTEAADGGGTTPAGLLASVTTPRGETAAYAYTAVGDLASVTRPTGERIQFGYDAIGRTVSRTDITDTYPAGLTTAYTYTPLSQPASVTYPPVTDQVTAATHTRRDAFTYDGDGNLTRLASSDLTGDDAERDTVYEYDEHGRLATLTDPEGGTVGYDHDEAGNLVGRTDADGNEFVFTYNDRDEVTSATLRDWSSDPTQDASSIDLVTDSYAYDPAGRLASHTDAMGRTDSYAYYGDDHLASVTRQRPAAGGGPVVTAAYGYDAAGNLVQRITGGGKAETDYTVDAAGRLAGATFDPAGLKAVVTYAYDADGDVTRVAETSGAGGAGGTPRTTDYTYDAGGHATGMAVSGDG